MGKIIQIKEEQIVNGGSNIPIYPITTAKATYYKDGKHIQKKIEETESGEILNDSTIITRHLRHASVTPNKLSKEVYDLFGNRIVIEDLNSKGIEIYIDSEGNIYAESYLNIVSMDINTGDIYIQEQ